jgi:opacity protein-like surface antigen
VGLFASILIAAVTGPVSEDLPRTLADDYPYSDSATDEELPSVAEAADPEPQYVPPPSKRPKNSSGVQFSIGAAGGYLKAHGADRGTWLAGVQARLHFLQFFAAEASVTFHQDRYQSGDVHVTQYPIQVSGLIYPIPNGVVSPYIVGGVGWYYSRITYSGGLSGFSDQREHTFGTHGGIGLDVRLGTSVTLDADLRYIFLDPSGTQLADGDFNYWQATVGVNFNF